MKNDRILDPLPHAEIKLELAYQGAVAPQFRDTPTSVQHFTWWYIERGPVALEFYRERHELPPGTMILFPVNFQRHHRFGDAARIISLGFKAAWPGARPWLVFPTPLIERRAKRHRLRTRGLAICKILGAIGRHGPVSIADRRLSTGDWCRLRGALLHFLADITDWTASRGVCLTAPTSGDPRLDEILSLLEAAPLAGPLPYEKWQRAVGCSRSQLDRLAVQSLGTTLRGWRDQLLAEAIRRDLRTTGYSMKELASVYGFADAAHFSRWVCRHTGAAPSRLSHPTV